MKVIFIADGIFPHIVGGMQRHSRLLPEALARLPDIDLTVVHPHQGITVFDPVLGIREIGLPPLPGKQYYLIELYKWSRETLRIIDAHPDAVIYSQGLSVWAGLNRVGHRVIINPHGLEPYQVMGWKESLKSWPIKKAFNRVLPRAARVVSLGGRLTAILEEVTGHQAGKVVVLPNAANAPPVPDTELVKRPSGPLRFLFTGRFVSNKGIDVLLEGASRLIQSGYEGKFVMDLIGKGPLFESLRSRYVSPQITFHGFVPDEELASWYRRNDVFILPTLFEGMPTVILEALSWGMPVIVTDTGATCDLVSDKNGMIIEKKSPSAVAAAMKEFIDMGPSRMAELSRGSLDHFHSRFTWEQVARRHEAVFREILPARGK